MQYPRYTGPGWALVCREPLSPHERAVIQDDAPLRSSASVARLVGPRVEHELVEVMYVLGLNGALRVMLLQEVARGALHSFAITPRDVFRAALCAGASSIVLVHNHPSGDARPSPEDVALTKVIAEGGRVLGMPLADHVIISPVGRYSSFLDMGLL